MSLDGLGSYCMDVGKAVPAAVRVHSSVREVRLVGSRAEGRTHELSDWDFAVETDDFSTLANDLPRLVAPLHPLTEQWDPYASHACYMLMFPGPTKVDLLFLDEHREYSPAWRPSAENLAAIDRHFWDWILWLEQKRTGGESATLESRLEDMFQLMLEPMGVSLKPTSVCDAIEAYVSARVELERTFGVTVPREVEQEVSPAVMRRQRPANSA
jgi:hypothetical protein